MNLSIKDLCVTYQDGDHMLLALEKINLELTPGTVTALVGESGSGKTTLARALMGLLPDCAKVSGSVRLDSMDLLSLSGPELNAIRWARMAMLFQNGAENLNPVYRIMDQIAEPLIQKQGLAREKAGIRAIKALEVMELEPGIARRYPHEVSGGELQRCLLAMAFIMDPEILILDEPTASLDAMTRNLVSRVILDARDRGKAILVITHDLDLARGVADEAMVLYLGQVMEVLPARELLHCPGHPYTLALGRSYPSLETHRDLGGIRGDAFYRIVHRHQEKNGAVRPHSHLIGPDPEHEDRHSQPLGCLFLDRCTQAIPDCAGMEIPMQESRGHWLRCIRGGIVTALRLKNISKGYKDNRALSSISINLKAGETFCLVGESGSGKTTAAMIAAGVLKHDNGSRVFNDRDMDDWIKQDYLSLAKKIGLIHQHPAQAVSHRLSVFDIIAEPLKIQKQGYGDQEIRNRVLAALKDVRLSTEFEFIHRYPHELNMGALQRVCIARALVSNPSLLVADEPTSSLDPSVQAKVLKMILNLQIEKGLTMLFVTHDLGLARKIADRIGVMLAGRIVETGPASQIMERPGHPYTSLLIAGTRGYPETAGSRKVQESRGCPFAGRCPRAKDACLNGFPALTETGKGNHFVWCNFPLST